MKHPPLDPPRWFPNREEPPSWKKTIQTFPRLAFTLLITALAFAEMIVRLIVLTRMFSGD